MKKTWTTFSVLLFLSLHVAAQDVFSPSTHLGLHTGMNLCRTRFSPSIQQHLFKANQTGLIFRHISEPQIGLQVELNFSQKGWIENRDTLGEYKRVLQTIDVPVTAVFLFGKKRLKLSFVIGPYLSYRKKENEVLNISDTAYFKDYYLKPLEHKLEFGLIGGLGLEWHHHIGIFALRGSFSYSLSKMFPLNVPEFYFGDSSMQVVNISVVYMFNL
ncbi:MAG: PorT family protein [Bacteroidales bacterium]|nr:PorT family protein [Bacteroidales bacterium]